MPDFAVSLNDAQVEALRYALDAAGLSTVGDYVQTLVATNADNMNASIDAKVLALGLSPDQTARVRAILVEVD